MIIGFPCNQFASQEPVSDNEMTQTCQTRYGVTFPLSQKIHVNGSDTHPIFKYLKDNTPNGILGTTIKRNFTKFLIDRKGNPLHRYAPTTSPEDIEDDIKNLLII
jgi:glutathione peroxidase